MGQCLISKAQRCRPRQTQDKILIRINKLSDTHFKARFDIYMSD